jgi:hypothetical protein
MLERVRMMLHQARVPRWPSRNYAIHSRRCGNQPLPRHAPRQLQFLPALRDVRTADERGRVAPMRQIYILFSDVGWGWAVIFGLFLAINKLWARKQPRWL